MSSTILCWMLLGAVDEHDKGSVPWMRNQNSGGKVIELLLAGKKQWEVSTL